MTRKRFFIDRLEPGSETALLSGEVAHHMENVLRLKPGDPVELQDGCGNGWSGVVAAIGSGLVRVRLEEAQQLRNESPLELTLAVAFARSDRMDLVVRQATEIGVQRLVAFRAKRSQYGLTGAPAAKRKERWLKISREALCQCGRLVLPEVFVLDGVADLLRYTASLSESGDGGSLGIVALEEGDKRRSLAELGRQFPECGRVTVVVGPEGGWSPGEVEQIKEAGFHAVHLGPRTLRFETAAIALLASIQLVWGDLGERVPWRMKV